MIITLCAVDRPLAEAWERRCGDLPGVSVHRGSILDLKVDAVVSPANSFGFMDGGIDALYTHRFGPVVQRRLQGLIVHRHHGELVVGAAEIVETDYAPIPFLVAAPTMRVPMVLGDQTVNPYLAARAALSLVKHHRFLHKSAAVGLSTGQRIGRKCLPDKAQSHALPRPRGRRACRAANLAAQMPCDLCRNLWVKHGVIPAGALAVEPVASAVRSLAFPGLGTGVGRVPADTCARQVRAAIEEVVLGRSAFPQSWAEASERHQFLYTDRARDLQRG